MGAATRIPTTGACELDKNAIAALFGDDGLQSSSAKISISDPLEDNGCSGAAPSTGSSGGSAPPFIHLIGDLFPDSGLPPEFFQQDWYGKGEGFGVVGSTTNLLGGSGGGGGAGGVLFSPDPRLVDALDSFFHWASNWFRTVGVEAALWYNDPSGSFITALNDGSLQQAIRNTLRTADFISSILDIKDQLGGKLEKPGPFGFEDLFDAFIELASWLEKLSRKVKAFYDSELQELKQSISDFYSFLLGRYKYDQAHRGDPAADSEIGPLYQLITTIYDLLTSGKF